LGDPAWSKNLPRTQADVCPTLPIQDVVCTSIVIGDRAEDIYSPRVLLPATRLLRQLNHYLNHYRDSMLSV
jgi:hypothetical protein